MKKSKPKISSKSFNYLAYVVKFLIFTQKSQNRQKSPSFWPKIAKKSPVANSIFCRQWGLEIANLATNRHFWSHCFQTLKNYSIFSLSHKKNSRLSDLKVWIFSALPFPLKIDWHLTERKVNFNWSDPAK